MDSATDVAEVAEPVVPQPVAEDPPPLTRMERRAAARKPWGAAVPWVIAAATLALRLLTAATGPTDWDSAQYAAAVSHFDVTHGQPQPPGYWLYVVAGRFVHLVSGLGTIRSLVVVAAVASAAAAGLTAVAGRDLGGPWVGAAAGLVVATCPFAWFSGSIVATYSFDMVGCSLLIILAWRARPGSWHGVAAVVALGLLCGFRQSMAQSFALLALIPVVASTRRWSRLVLTIVAGAAAVAVWLIPMSLNQPGGFSAWARATHIEATGAAQATSVFDHVAAGTNNIGTFAGYTTVALAPLALVALLAGLVLGLRRLGHAAGRRDLPPGAPAVDDGGDPAPLSDSSPDSGVGPGGETNGGSSPGPGAWCRPWYQSRSAVLIAAIVPPMLVVALVQFAKGGYLLAYLPAAVIALLLPLGALNRRTADATGSSPAWLTVTSLAVVVIVALGAQRFLSGGGVLPQHFVSSSGALWFEQPRYQAPYAGTRLTIRDADATDIALARPRPVGRFLPRRGGVRHRRRRPEHLPQRRLGTPGRPHHPGPARRGSLQPAAGRPLLQLSQDDRGRALGVGHPRRLPQPPRTGRPDRHACRPAGAHRTDDRRLPGLAGPPRLGDPRCPGGGHQRAPAARNRDLIRPRPPRTRRRPRIGR